MIEFDVPADDGRVIADIPGRPDSYVVVDDEAERQQLYEAVDAVLREQIAKRIRVR